MFQANLEDVSHRGAAADVFVALITSQLGGEGRLRQT